MLSAGVILSGNIASHCGKGSRGKGIPSIYMVDQILNSFFHKKTFQMVMLQKTGNVVLEIFQENTGSLHRFIKLYDHRGKIHAVLKKLRLSQLQTEICNFVVIGRWKSQLLCQPGSDFLRMDRFATMGAELLFVKSLRFQNCSLYFLGMQRLFDVIDGF